MVGVPETSTMKDAGRPCKSPDSVEDSNLLVSTVSLVTTPKAFTSRSTPFSVSVPPKNAPELSNSNSNDVESYRVPLKPNSVYPPPSLGISKRASVKYGSENTLPTKFQSLSKNCSSAGGLLFTKSTDA